MHINWIELTAYSLMLGLPLFVAGYGLARMRESDSRRRELGRLHRWHERNRKRTRNRYLEHIERIEQDHQHKLDASCQHVFQRGQDIGFEAGRRSVLDRPELAALTGEVA